MNQATRGLAAETVEATCKTHGTYTAEVFRAGKEAVASSCPVCYEERAAAAEQEEVHKAAVRRRERIKENRLLCELPERFESATFDQYGVSSDQQKRALQAAINFAKCFPEVSKRGSCLTMIGAPGTGKTHLAAAIANKLLDAGHSVYYRTAYDILLEIKRSWRSLDSCRSSHLSESTESESQLIKRYSRADLLILDEIGVQFGSETEKILLFELLDTRYGALKSTIVISNLDEKGLSDSIGARVLDRLAEAGSAVLSFKWPSYRRLS